MKKKIRNFPYYVYNDGRIQNQKSKYFLTPYQVTNQYGYYYVKLQNKEKGKVFNIAKLVLKYFKPTELTKTFKYPLHIDYKMENNEVSNLKKGKRGDRMREIYTLKNKQRGVYTWNQGPYKKYRVAFKLDNKLKTFGYYNTKKEAKVMFIKHYTSVYGVSPYSEVNV